MKTGMRVHSGRRNVGWRLSEGGLRICKPPAPTPLRDGLCMDPKLPTQFRDQNLRLRSFRSDGVHGRGAAVINFPHRFPSLPTKGSHHQTVGTNCRGTGKRGWEKTTGDAVIQRSWLTCRSLRTRGATGIKPVTGECGYRLFKHAVPVSRGRNG